LEFKPKNSFQAATKYEVKIKNHPKLLYPFEEKKFSFSTLKINFDLKKFDPKDSIILTSNFPVLAESLEKNLKIYE
jgi:hypothetical protein